MGTMQKVGSYPLDRAIDFKFSSQLGFCCVVVLQGLKDRLVRIQEDQGAGGREEDRNPGKGSPLTLMVKTKIRRR